MDEFYYIINKHKVRLLSWCERRQRFLILQDSGVAQYVPENLLEKTTELVPESEKIIDSKNWHDLQD
jgi:hypothetical protein